MIIGDLCQHQGVEFVEGQALPDHIHLCPSIALKHSVSNTMGFIEETSVPRLLADVPKRSTGAQSLVSMVGRTAARANYRNAARVTAFLALALSSATVLPPARADDASNWCGYGRLAPPSGEGPALAAPAGGHVLAIQYAVPSDIAPSPAVLARIKRASADIQAWYQCSTGGVTWEFAYPETVRVYMCQRVRQYYLDNGNWWGSLLGEMDAAGVPIWEPGFVTTIWAHGAGWWAGAAQWCGVECGVALLGVEVFPEFNNPTWSGGTCPAGNGVAAWPCTPEGAYAHELGHTVGLPHPADVPATQPVASHSIMQTHWNYPRWAPPSEQPWGFLRPERQTILGNAFMHWGVPLEQVHSDCDIVNLPAGVTAPAASFVRVPISTPFTFAATNTSTGATTSYWTFGDRTASNAMHAAHDYTQPGSYPVILRVMNSSAAMDTATATMIVETSSAPFVAGSGIELDRNRPNPFAEGTSLAFRLGEPGDVDLAVYSVDGKRVRTLLRGAKTAGEHRTRWDGRDEGGQRVPSGVYFLRLATGGRAQSRTMIAWR